MSEIEGDAYEDKKRKRLDSDNDDKASKSKEKPAKKKLKKKAKSEETESTPGKYVLLRPQEDEEENPEAASIQNVGRHAETKNILADFCVFRLGTKSECCRRRFSRRSSR